MLYNGASPNPYILIDEDVSAYLGAFATHSLLGIGKGGRPEECDVRANEAVITNANLHRIQNGAIPAD
jgi:hypothetical protein